MSTKRVSRKITNQKDLDYLLNINHRDDYTRTFIMETFGDFGDGPRFNPYDIIVIPPGAYGTKEKHNKKQFTTTVGLWVYNKFIIEPCLLDICGYINETITKGRYGNITQDAAYALMEDRLDIEQMKRFITYNEFLMSFVSVISTNDTVEVLTVSSYLEPYKKELIKKYDKEIKDGDVITASKMEKELLDKALEHLHEDPGMDSYVSGSRASLGNNFKNIYVMKGAIRDPLTNDFQIATSNYNDGISAEEYQMFANSLAGGAYNRSNKTQLGGYWEKLFVAAFQHIKILPPGSDCKTNRYIEVRLDKPKDYIYSYMIEGDKLVQLTSENMDKYKGKKVKLRYSSMCQAKNGYCSVCAGELFHKLGLTNIGLALPAIPSKLKNLAMKSFHDSTQSLVEMDLNRAFGFDGHKELR